MDDKEVVDNIEKILKDKREWEVKDGHKVEEIVYVNPNQIKIII